MKLLFVLIALTLLSLACSPKVLGTEIIHIGISNAQTGPASRLGTDLNVGADLYFNDGETQRLLKQRRIKTTYLDDGYEPVHTLINTKHFIADNVVALFNYVGTPTSNSVLNTIQNTSIPYVTPFTGADFLREPNKVNVYNIRASYKQEAAAQIDFLINNLKVNKIGLLIQADEFGLVVERYYTQILQQYEKSIDVIERYKRNTSDMVIAADILKENNVDAVLFVGTYQPLTNLITELNNRQHFPVYSSVSFISSSVLFDMIPKDTKIIVTEVVPDPVTCQEQLCFMFRAAAKKNQLNHINRTHFEGFINAYYLVKAISQCHNKEMRSCLLQALLETEIEWSGSKLKLNKLTRQLLNNVYLNKRNI